MAYQTPIYDSIPVLMGLVRGGTMSKTGELLPLCYNSSPTTLADVDPKYRVQQEGRITLLSELLYAYT